jgi:tetratricopeptide (TPR) repeat protein
MAALMGDQQRAIALAREGLASIDPATDPGRAAHFHSSLRWYLWDAGEHEAALQDALEAVRLMPADPPTNELANVHAHAAGLLLFAGRLSAAEAEARQALATAQLVGARPEEAVALGVLGWIHVVRGDPDQGVELVREAWRIARSLGHVTGLAVAYNHLAAVLDLAGRVRESLDVAREGIAEAERLGTARSFGAQLEGNAAHALLRLGRWDDAEAMTDAALGRGAAPGPLAWLRIVRARLDSARGRFASSESELRAVDAAPDPASVLPYVGWWYVARAEVAFWQGDPATVLELVQAAFDDPRLPEIDASVGTLAALGLGASADVVESEPPGSTRSDAARASAAPIREHVRRLRRSGLLAPPDLPTAGPARGRGAQTAKVALVVAEAARLSERQVAPSWRRLIAAAEVEERAPLVAYGRYRLAAALLASRSDRDQVARVIRDAHALAVELGAVPLTARIEASPRPDRPWPIADAGARANRPSGSLSESSTCLRWSSPASRIARSARRSSSAPRRPVHVPNILAGWTWSAGSMLPRWRWGMASSRLRPRSALDGRGRIVPRRPALESASWAASSW